MNGTSVGTTSPYTISNVKGETSIDAQFAINTYTIHATAGANGGISPLGDTTVTYGGSQQYTITPNSGYHISAITVNGTSVGTTSPYTVSNVRGYTTIDAQFALDILQVTYVSAGAGNGDYDSGMFDDNNLEPVYPSSLQARALDLTAEHIILVPIGISHRLQVGQPTQIRTPLARAIDLLKTGRSL